MSSTYQALLTALLLSACSSPRTTASSGSAPVVAASATVITPSPRDPAQGGGPDRRPVPQVACLAEQFVTPDACFATLASACASLGCSECMYNERVPMIVSCVRR